MHLEQYLVNSNILHTINGTLNLLNWEKQIAKLNSVPKLIIKIIIILFKRDNYTLYHTYCEERIFFNVLQIQIILI